MGFKLFESSASDFLRQTLWGVINERTRTVGHRHDLIDTLIELRKSQTPTDIDDPEVFSEFIAASSQNWYLHSPESITFSIRRR